MKKLAVWGIGFGLVLLGCYGMWKAANEWEKPPTVREDIETKGIVTRVTVTELKHAIGVTIDRTFRLNFEFVAQDGQTYSGQEIIDQAQANTLSEGDEVTVKYHSNNPSINAAIYYGTYIPADTFGEQSPQTRMMFCSVFCVMGLLVLAYAKLSAQEQRELQGELESNNPAPAQQSFAANV